MRENYTYSKQQNVFYFKNKSISYKEYLNIGIFVCYYLVVLLSTNKQLWSILANFRPNPTRPAGRPDLYPYGHL